MAESRPLLQVTLRGDISRVEAVPLRSCAASLTRHAQSCGSWDLATAYPNRIHRLDVKWDITNTAAVRRSRSTANCAAVMRHIVFGLRHDFRKPTEGQMKNVLPPFSA
jgi:hypothetical protein